MPSPRTRLAGFAVVLAALVAGGYAVGSRFPTDFTSDHDHEPVWQREPHELHRVDAPDQDQAAQQRRGDVVGVTSRHRGLGLFKGSRANDHAVTGLGPAPGEPRAEVAGTAKNSEYRKFFCRHG